MLKIILSCEHGGNVVPEPMSAAFVGAQDVLDTHRAIDFGALQLFRKMNTDQVAFSTYETITRLLIELNRGLYSEYLFSDFSMRLTGDQRIFLLNEVYKPYRKEIEKKIQHFTQANHQVLHVGVHSFTPVLNNETRTTDIGILFDPERINELDFAHRWKQLLHIEFPDLSIDFNKPYLGIDDGLTTDMRALFPGNCYAGIELEVNQKFTLEPYWEEMMEKISESFFASLSNE